MSEFEEIFDNLCRTQDRSIIWNNWLDYCININLIHEKSHYINNNFYDNEEDYYRMFSEWINELQGKLDDNKYYDMIGALYEENVQSKGKAKDFQQYFTPQDVTVLMTQLATDKLRYDNGFANDCCCGSGRFLLAIHVESKGELYSIGQDLDETSVKMCVLNFWSHGVRGSVLHMNTLTGEFFKGWRVNRYLYHGIPVPHIEEIFHPSEAYDFIGVDYDGDIDDTTAPGGAGSDGGVVKQTTLI